VSRVSNDLVSARLLPGVDERGAAGAPPGRGGRLASPGSAIDGPADGCNHAPTKSSPALRANRCRFGC